MEQAATWICAECRADEVIVGICRTLDVCYGQDPAAVEFVSSLPPELVEPLKACSARRLRLLRSHGHVKEGLA